MFLPTRSVALIAVLLPRIAGWLHSVMLPVKIPHRASRVRFKGIPSRYESGMLYITDTCDEVIGYWRMP